MDNLPVPVEKEAEIMATNMLRALGEKILDAVHASEYKAELAQLRLERNGLIAERDALKAELSSMTNQRDDAKIELELLREAQSKLQSLFDSEAHAANDLRNQVRQIQHRLDTIRGVAEGRLQIAA